MINCTTMPIPGVTVDGGYADHILADAHALAAIPDELSAVEAAPLMCAGVTTFNALRNSGVGPGDLVAVLGVGGLGHLGVQYAARAGYRTVAIARGRDKEKLARQLGAVEYIDSTTEDPAAALQALGGAKVILSTVTNAEAMSAVVGGLAPRGQLMVIGASMDPIEVPPAVLIGSSTSITGHASGTSKDTRGRRTRWRSAPSPTSARWSRRCRSSRRPRPTTRCCEATPASAWCSRWSDAAGDHTPRRLMPGPERRCPIAPAREPRPPPMALSTDAARRQTDVATGSGCGSATPARRPRPNPPGRRPPRARRRRSRWRRRGPGAPASARPPPPR